MGRQQRLSGGEEVHAEPRAITIAGQSQGQPGNPFTDLLKGIQWSGERLTGTDLLN